MADYTYRELMKMQNDAIKRVEDMQKRARFTAGLDEAHAPEQRPKPPADPPNRIPMPSGYLENAGLSRDKVAAQGPAQKISFLNGDIEIDSDRALLLSLILLLSEEKADELLLMALVYMMG